MLRIDGGERGGEFFSPCQKMLKEWLGELVPLLFAELTGFDLHLTWHHSCDFDPATELTVLCPKANRTRATTNVLTTTCRSCLQERWATVVLAPNDMCRFQGLCGSVNMCASLQWADVRPLTLVLQAPSAALHPQSTEIRRSGGKVLDKPDFSMALPAVTKDIHADHAEALFQLISRHLMEAFNSRGVEIELQHAGLRMPSHDSVSANPYSNVHGDIGDKCSPRSVCASSLHVQQIVRMVLNYIHGHYHHPMSLREVAAELQMNANYLSELFSKTMGMTFHCYVQSLRLAKAEELLSAPCVRVSDVAYAVGYSNPNYFRAVFKMHEGMSPSAWRKISASPSRASEL